MMSKKLILLLAIVATSFSFTEAKKARCCKKHRTISARVGFSNPVVVTPTVPCLGSSLACSTKINTTATVLSGDKNCFTLSPVAPVILLQNVCPPLVPVGCPSLYKSTVSSFDVTFKKPFKEAPAVTLGIEITPVSVGGCLENFTLAFKGGAGTGLPVQAQEICDADTTFFVSIISSSNLLKNVTNKGFTQELGLVYAACPAGLTPPSNDDFCTAILELALLFYPRMPFFFAASFTATGR